MRRFGGQEGRERRWTGLDRLESRNRPPRSLLVALVLASITLITLDVSGGGSSPQPAARAARPSDSATRSRPRPGIDGATAVPRTHAATPLTIITERVIEPSATK